MAAFKRIFDADEALDITLDVNVCTTGYWPSSKIVPCNMPKELGGACEKYKRSDAHASTHGKGAAEEENTESR